MPEEIHDSDARHHAEERATMRGENVGPPRKPYFLEVEWTPNGLLAMFRPVGGVDNHNLNRVTIYRKSVRIRVTGDDTGICVTQLAQSPEVISGARIEGNGFCDEQNKMTPWNVRIDGELLDPEPSSRLRRHSLRGYSWGYEESGAALALAILLRFTDEESALAWQEAFRLEVTSELSWPHFVLDGATVQEWVDERKAGKGN